MYGSLRCAKSAAINKLFHTIFCTIANEFLSTLNQDSIARKEGCTQNYLPLWSSGQTKCWRIINITTTNYAKTILGWFSCGEKEKAFRYQSSLTINDCRTINHHSNHNKHLGLCHFLIPCGLHMLFVPL